jgi:hypothetical protein
LLKQELCLKIQRSNIHLLIIIIKPISSQQSFSLLNLLLMLT